MTAPLPWKTPPQTELVEVGDARTGVLDIPKLWSVTPDEELAVLAALRALPDGQIFGEGGVKLHAALATILLRRVNPDQSESETRQLPSTLVAELADFLLSERRRWVPVEEADADPKAPTGKSTKPRRENSSPKPTGGSAPAGQTSSAATSSDARPSP